MSSEFLKQADKLAEKCANLPMDLSEAAATDPAVSDAAARMALAYLARNDYGDPQRPSWLRSVFSSNARQARRDYDTVAGPLGGPPDALHMEEYLAEQMHEPGGSPSPYWAAYHKGGFPKLHDRYTQHADADAQSFENWLAGKNPAKAKELQALRSL